LPKEEPFGAGEQKEIKNLRGCRDAQGIMKCSKKTSKEKKRYERRPGRKDSC